MNSIEIQSPYDINLKKDALIEASAGTGKTWTLTRLIIRLILEEQIPLESILIVTFTEKAAGEMKERLRQLLEETANSGKFMEKTLKAEEQQLLGEHALNYDNAAIQTIHSFCLNTLQHYAFENAFHFQLEQIDDKAVATEAFHQILNEILIPKYRRKIEHLLRISGLKKGGMFEKSWEEQAISLALNTHPKYSTILPQPISNLDDTLDKLLTQLSELLRQVSRFSAILHKNGRDFIQTAKEFQEKNIDLLNLFPVSDELSFMKNKQQTPEQEELLSSLNSTIKKINAAGKSFFTEAIQLTRKSIRSLKEKRQQISFSDMLIRVEEGLQRKDGLLLHSLRRQFKVALVDEFQDTDPVQWNIFRTLFLESHKHRLFIIGDPKQAIYSFRGANINTYYTAAKTIQKNNNSYRLPVNYRSAPAAIEGTNIFFEKYLSPPLDSPSEQKFTPFYPVKIPNDPQNRIQGDPNECGLFGSEIDSTLNADNSRQEAASRIAIDCLRILNSGLKISINKKQFRPLLPEDICILTRKKSSSRLIEKELLRHQIPCSIYKKEGIYSSTEALHISLILRYLSDPDNNDLTKLALLTPFFKKQDNTLPSVPETDTKAGKYLKKLRTLAKKRHWGELFNSLIHESGFSFREYGSPEGPRRLTNLEQISQNLETAALSEGFDTHRLSEHLQRLINNQTEGEMDEDLHRIESEESQVQIMTIHASKGLEFPFVYVTSPLEDGGMSPNWYTWTGEDGKRKHDLQKRKENKEKHEHEQREEKKRLLYVALTRGIFRTTIFFSEKQTAGLAPIARNLPQACITNIAEKKIYSHTTPDIHKETPPDPLFRTAKNFYKTGYTKRRISLASFSSLLNHVTGEITFGEQEKQPDEAETVPPTPETEGNILLPRGPQTGNLLHSLLEKTDFTTAQNTLEMFQNANLKRIKAALLKSRIRPVSTWTPKNSGIQNETLSSASLLKEAVKQIGKMLYNALNTKLTAEDGSKFTLSEIERSKTIHELEFHFIISPDEAKQFPEQFNWFSSGFLTGFIDLIFLHKERYYILDWKSNWLPNYSKQQLSESMNKHNYHLQASIYAEALRRWLNSRKNISQNNTFGGVFYLFLRGLSPDGEGVVSIPKPAPFPFI